VANALYGAGHMHWRIATDTRERKREDDRARRTAAWKREREARGAPPRKSSCFSSCVSYFHFASESSIFDSVGCLDVRCTDVSFVVRSTNSPSLSPVTFASASPGSGVLRKSSRFKNSRISLEINRRQKFAYVFTPYLRLERARCLSTAPWLRSSRGKGSAFVDRVHLSMCAF